MKRTALMVAMVVGGIWYAGRAVDSVQASHTAHAEKVARLSHNVRGL